MSPESVVTFQHVDGFRVVKSFGFAYGQATRPRNVLRATFRSIGAFIGLQPIEFLTDAERARTECLNELMRKSEASGANGIIGLQFQASETPDGATKVLAFGEAVLLDPLPK